MYKDDTLYIGKSDFVARWSGILAAFFMTIYVILIQSELITTARNISDFFIYLFLMWWIAVGIIRLVAPINNSRLSWMIIIAYHLLAGSFIMYMSGINTPFMTFWVILAVFSYVNAKKAGLILSMSLFTTFIIMDILLYSSDSTMSIIQDISTLLFIITASAIAVKVFQTQEISKIELEKSKAKEILQRDRILTIVNNLTDAILSTDMNGIIRVYNASSLNLLDTNTGLNGQHIDDVLPLFDQDNNSISLVKELKKTKIAIKRDDLEFRFDENEKIRLELTMSPIRSSYNHSQKGQTHDGYIIIMRDVTKAKSLEEERDEFISVTSHELRTPITIAEGTLSNMQIMIGHPHVTQTMLKDAVHTAHDQILFLANMVNDLSTLSRAERGVADVAEEIDVQELAHKIFDKYSVEAEQKKLHLNLNLSPKLGTVNVSRLYLEELLQNFVTNSLKYTKEGSIKIDFSKKNDTITFAVTDTGIGISKSDQAKIFKKFYRSEDYRTRETGGTGLGLYIAMKLAKKIGTQINVESRLNHGSTFSFQLPDSSPK
jgi:signal transduction histidine kinase